MNAWIHSTNLPSLPSSPFRPLAPGMPSRPSLPLTPSAPALPVYLLNGIWCVHFTKIILMASSELPGTPSRPGSPGIPSRPSKPGLPGMLQSLIYFFFSKLFNPKNDEMTNLLSPFWSPWSARSFSASRSGHANVTAISFHTRWTGWSNWKIQTHHLHAPCERECADSNTWSWWTIFFCRTAESGDCLKLQRRAKINTATSWSFLSRLISVSRSKCISFDTQKVLIYFAMLFILLVHDFVIALRRKQMLGARTDIDTLFTTPRAQLLLRFREKLGRKWIFFSIVLIREREREK